MVYLSSPITRSALDVSFFLMKVKRKVLRVHVKKASAIGNHNEKAALAWQIANKFEKLTKIESLTWT